MGLDGWAKPLDELQEQTSSLHAGNCSPACRELPARRLANPSWQEQGKVQQAGRMAQPLQAGRAARTVHAERFHASTGAASPPARVSSSGGLHPYAFVRTGNGHGSNLGFCTVYE